MNRRRTADAAVGAAVGVLLGCVTVAGVYDLYPPVPHHVWLMPLIGCTSLGVVGLLYLAARQPGRLGAGDVLVLAYAGALLAAVAVAMTGEAVHALRAQMPGGVV